MKKLLGKLLGTPNIDPTLGDLPLKQAVDALARGDFEPARTMLAGSPDVAARYFVLMNLVSARRGEPIAMRAWREACPEDANAYLLEGVGCIYWAWDARGSGFADTVSEEAAQVFMQRLAVADRLLEAACALAPRDPLPLAERLVIDRAVGRVDEARDRLERIQQLDPRNFLGHLEFFDLIKAKWQGSDEQMFEFARTIRQRHPGDGNMAIFIALAHEEVINMALAQGDVGAAKAVTLDRDARDEVARAFDETFATLETGTPSFRPDALTPMAANLMLGTLWSIDHRGRARALIRWLDGRYTPSPWTNYEDGGPKTLREVLNWAGMR